MEQTRQDSSDETRAHPDARIITTRLDRWLTRPAFGIPFFLGLMYLVFYLTFTIGRYPVAWIETFFTGLNHLIAEHWPAWIPTMLKSLIADGIIGGVGAVITFVPNILLLFAAIGALEESGYMARAAYALDWVMRKVGLHAKSFVPMMLGFGCSVPAIMATRMLESKRDRLTTMMVIPLISCGGRFPIYALIIPAFFPPQWQARVLWFIYLIGIALAIGLAKLLKKTLFRGAPPAEPLRLYPYRMPQLRHILRIAGESGWHYLKKAGTVLLGISVLLWVISSYPRLPEAERPGLSDTPQARGAALAYSMAGRIGQWSEPVIRPLGFDWRIGTALLGAFAAKEVFVAQLGVVFAVGDPRAEHTSLQSKLRAAYTPLQAFCIMLFMLIGIPCSATCVVTHRESGSWRLALLQLAGLTVLAYGVTLIAYQAGRLLGWS